MTAIELRDALLDLIGDQLGTWKTGDRAISIGHPPATLAPSTGIQCVITPHPNGVQHPTMGRSIYHDQSWEITFVRISGAGDMPRLARALGRLVRVRRVDYRPASISTAEQVTCNWFDPGFVPKL